MSQEIVLYDLPSTAKENAWSANVWKVRYTYPYVLLLVLNASMIHPVRFVLNIKKLPYRTVWADFHDLKRFAAEIGCAATSKWADGSLKYTVPMIKDPNTGKVMADSFKIVEYLDETYPDTPRMMLPGATSLYMAMEVALRPSFPLALVAHCIGSQFHIIKPESKQWYRMTREKALGDRKLEDLVLQGAALDKLLIEVEKGLAAVASWYKDESTLTLVGDSLGFADLLLCSYLIWFRIVLGEDSAFFKKVMSYQNGRWERLLLSVKDYETVI
jgi:glutathione S-transferase